jgi:GTPase-activating protein SST2
MAAFSQYSRPTIQDPHSPIENPTIATLSPSNEDGQPRSSISSHIEPSPSTPVSPVNTHPRQTHQYSQSTSGLSSPNRQRSSGLLAFAASAIDKTQSAIANISDPVLRSRQSNSALARLSLVPDYSQGPLDSSNSDRSPRVRSPSSHSTSSSNALRHPAAGKYSSQTSLVKDPPAQSYADTNPNYPPPVRLPNIESKMHQTSSRLLRMTDDDRPFTRVRIHFLWNTFFFFFWQCPAHLRGFLSCFVLPL